MAKINTGDLPLPGTELPAGSCQNPWLPSSTQNVTLQFSWGFPKKLVWWHQGVPSKSKRIMYHWLYTVPISPSYPGYIYPPVIKCGNGKSTIYSRCSHQNRQFSSGISSHVRLPEGNHHISHENPIFKPYPMGIPMGNPHPAIMKPLMIHPWGMDPAPGGLWTSVAVVMGNGLYNGICIYYRESDAFFIDLCIYLLFYLFYLCSYLSIYLFKRLHI